VVELPIAIQAKLLRVLEQGEVHPLGVASPLRVDVRFVAAAQRPLADAVAAERFRDDLHARLDGVTLLLPPLRERRADVPAIFAHALRDATGGRPPRVDARLVERLCLYDWPRNARELAQVARRLVALHHDAPVLREAHLPESIRAGAGAAPREPRPAAERAAPPAPGEQLPRLLDALRAHRGNVLRAAESVGISRFRAYRLLRAHPEVDWKQSRDEG
jgi:DNA-binding NtrC family response regulator